MKRIDITNKSREELQIAKGELQSRLIQLRFEEGEKKLKDFSQFNKIKKDIARVLTALNATK